MSMFYILFSIAFIISLLLNLYFWLTKPDVSIETAKNKLKAFLVREIVFYHQNYTGLEQLQLIAKWIQVAKDKIKQTRPEEKKMLIEIMKEL